MIRRQGQAVVERHSITFGATTIEYSIRRSRRRKKTIAIALHPNGGVIVSVPIKTTTAEVARIVHKRAGWILRKSAEPVLQPCPPLLVSGETLPYLGRQVPLFVEATNRRRVAVDFDDWSLRVAVPGHLAAADRREAILQALKRWYRLRAQESIEARVRLWSGKLGSQITRVLTRDQRRIWGSCAADGTIRFNWRLVMAEPTLIDYVVVHELMHLKARNHGPQFWANVAAVLPDYDVRRRRLQDFGMTLPF